MNVAALANGAWLVSSFAAWRRLKSAFDHPQRAQHEVLHRLVSTNRHTAFGRAHGFERISCWEDFCQHVPLLKPDGLEPWIDRIRQGESCVLTREKITRLVPTSGSTEGRKWIPFTAAFQQELNAAVGPWMVDLAQQFPRIVGGPAYWSISPAVDVSTAVHSAVPLGFDDDTAYLGGWRQRWVDAAMAVPSAVRFAPSVEEFRYLTLLFLLRQRELRLVSVWHPSFLTLLLDALPRVWDELLADVAEGGCQRLSALPPALERVLRGRPDPKRSAELKSLGPASARALWPKWDLVSCWADAQAAIPARDLERRLPGIAIQGKGLIATEAVVTIPFAGKHPLAIRSHFYEFVDIAGTVRRAHQLNRGERYRVVVTTGSGLWRYVLGDVVEVDGFVGATPSLRFIGRGDRVSDLCGEKLEESFVTHAVQAACAACGAVPSFTLLAPEQGREGCSWHYTFFVQDGAQERLASLLEQQLCANPHYAWCRQLGQLGAVEVCLLPAGAYTRFCVEVAEEGSGRHLGDVKPQILSGRTDWRKVLLNAKESQTPDPSLRM